MKTYKKAPDYINKINIKNLLLLIEDGLLKVKTIEYYTKTVFDRENKTEYLMYGKLFIGYDFLHGKSNEYKKKFRKTYYNISDLIQINFTSTFDFDNIDYSRLGGKICLDEINININVMKKLQRMIRKIK